MLECFTPYDITLSLQLPVSNAPLYWFGFFQVSSLVCVWSSRKTITRLQPSLLFSLSLDLLFLTVIFVFLKKWFDSCEV